MSDGFVARDLAYNQRNDVAAMINVGNPSLSGAISKSSLGLKVRAQLDQFSDATDAAAPAATAGGRDVVKIKPGAWDRIASHIMAEVR
jgi:hypothetical protein